MLRDIALTDANNPLQDGRFENPHGLDYLYVIISCLSKESSHASDKERYRGKINIKEFRRIALNNE
jgi:hypothetical protein